MTSQFFERHFQILQTRVAELDQENQQLRSQLTECEESHKIAREQEKAAQERAAELAKANEALK